MDPDPDSRAIDAGTAALPEGVQLETLLDRADRSPDGTSPRCLSVYDGLGLVGLIELDVVEIQTRGARLDKRDHPDRLVFELVGEGGPEFERVLEAAGEVRARLADFGLVSFVKTSGREHSLDVVVPVQRRRSYASVARFCRVFAEGMVAAAPRRYTLGTGRSAPEASVRGKVAIRHALNSRAATMIAPYSLCAATGGLVSTPLAWDELRTGLRPDSFDPASVATRLARLGEDPWTGYFTLRQWITKASFRRLDINPDLRELAARI